ncbi:MAG: TonB-dependent receptor [Myxococcota bacterium]
MVAVGAVPSRAYAQDQISEEDFFGDDEEDAGDESPSLGDGSGEDDGATPPPVPADQGVLFGTIRDGTGQPALEALIRIVGTNRTVRTDYDGRYRIELPPGTYNLSIFLPTHDTLVLEGVEVVAGEQIRIDDSLDLERGADEAIETLFEVEVEADESSLEGQILTRKRAAVVGDSLGRQEIRRTPDRNAAAAVRRVPGVLIVNGKFVYVRGIGERYTNALLDGSPLPSPEPEQQTVPLDLFPTTVLDSLTVVKTFTPDQIGSFAGGSIRIGTRRLPRDFTFSLSASLGFNSQATFQDTLSYEGGDLDWLGIDDGSRRLPRGFTNQRIAARIRRPDGSFFTNEELADLGRQIDRPMSTRTRLGAPNHRFSATVGDTIELGGEQKLGYSLTASYNRSLRHRNNLRFVTADPVAGGGLLLRNDFRVTETRDAVRWATLGGLTYQIDPRHRIHLTGLFAVSADDTAFELEGSDRELGDDIHETRLTFESRRLAYGQLRGDHEFPALADARLDWNLSLAHALRDQPDTRATVFQSVDAGGIAGWQFADDAQSGLHFFSTLDEVTIGAGADWLQPLTRDDDGPKIKLGGRADLRRREFDARRYRYAVPPPPFTPETDTNSPTFCRGATFRQSCPDRAISDAALDVPVDETGTPGSPFLRIDEGTLPTDAYTADVDIYAVYAMADFTPMERLRVIAGPRIELARQDIRTFAPFAPDDPENQLTTEVTGDDILPGISIVYEVIDDMNVRVAGSRTVARPQLREIAPFQFINYFNDFPEEGNPNLRFTRIWNGDLRWEWFPTLREVIAASFFAKRFEDPIEPVILPAGAQGVITYQNSPSANLIGGELEARKNFGFVAPALDDLSLIANFTLALSEVTFDERGNNTNAERPLANQAPWIINVSLDYANLDPDLGLRARILYNIVGPRIVQVGAGGLPDIYEQPRHQLDITAAKMITENFEVTASGRNLINHRLLQTFGPRVSSQVRYRATDGITVSTGLRLSY